MARASRRTERDLRAFGENVRGWRKVLGLTAEAVAERAGITRTTLRSIETGEGSVRLENAFAVLRILGQAESVILATDPHTSELGRLRATQGLPQRVRTRRPAAP